MIYKIIMKTQFQLIAEYFAGREIDAPKFSCGFFKQFMGSCDPETYYYPKSDPKHLNGSTTVKTICIKTYEPRLEIVVLQLYGAGKDEDFEPRYAALFSWPIETIDQKVPTGRPSHVLYVSLLSKRAKFMSYDKTILKDDKERVLKILRDFYLHPEEHLAEILGNRAYDIIEIDEKGSSIRNRL